MSHEGRTARFQVGLAVHVWRVEECSDYFAFLVGAIPAHSATPNGVRRGKTSSSVAQARVRLRPHQTGADRRRVRRSRIFRGSGELLRAWELGASDRAAPGFEMGGFDRECMSPFLSHVYMVLST